MKKLGIFLIVGFALLLVTGCGDDDTTTRIPGTDIDVNKNGVRVSTEQFEEATVGMTKEQVWEIIGGKCGVSAQTADPDTGDVIDLYNCEGSDGSYAVLFYFQNGKLTNKVSTAGY